MNISLSFIRIFFLMMSILFVTTYTTTVGGLTVANAIIGVISGAAFGLALIGADTIFKRVSLRTFNIAMLGLFCGYLMGEALFLTFKTIFDLTALELSTDTIALFRVGFFLFSAYLGMIMTARAADEIYVSIPFINFKPTSRMKKDILLDTSALMDTRIIDLAASGLVDNNLVIPRFTVNELNAMLESMDEHLKNKARRCLDAAKKLEAIPGLELRYADHDFPELKDTQAKLLRLARSLDANILTADMSRLQQAQTENIKFINLNMLANALKPVTQTGESIHIKIQRYGKEPRQGVGYLEDGTMVVVNGGAEYIGETIKAQVLSVKHTSSGRMIFCNAMEEGMTSMQEVDQTVADMENSHKNYFAI